jgi:NADH dehydrogenase
MKIAVTGGTGFVGGHLARRLVAAGHEVVSIGRQVGLDDEGRLAGIFASCDAVAHCAGINREIGRQTYRRVHVDGTRNVIRAAKRGSVKKVVLVSFLRARPDCGSAYHESKWAAEEIVRGSGLDYTVLKCGVIYGVGDHMLDHLSHAFHSLPVFGLVGFTEQRLRPTAVEDVAKILMASLVEGRLSRQTVAVMGPEELTLTAAVQRVAGVVGRQPTYLRMPVWFHYALGWLAERLMKVPLVSIAQVRILSEGIVAALPAAEELPVDLRPSRPFSEEQIRHGLPAAGGFTWKDCRCLA